LFANYLLCAILAAIAGLVVVGGTNAADLSLADSYLLPLVACVVIGGTSIFGGRGGYAGTIIGALILTVLTGLLTLLDVSEPIKQLRGDHPLAGGGLRAFDGMIGGSPPP
jgi:ribose transport system permease protein